MKAKKFNWKASLTALAMIVVVFWGVINIGAAKSFVIRVVGGGSTYGSYVKFYDEDDMASDDAYGVPSQQSVKAFMSGGASPGSFTTLSATSTTALKGPVTINGLTSDQDTTIYGNNGTAVLFVDAGNLRVGVNDITPSYGIDVTGTGQITGDVVLGGAVTVNGGTADKDVTIYGNNSTAILFTDGGNLRVGINDVTPSAALDINGTMIVQSNTVVTLESGTYDVVINVADASTNAVISHAPQTGSVPLVLEMDYTQSGDTNTTWSGSSVALATGATTGAGIRVMCGGTITGANAAKTVYLQVGSGAGSTVLTLATPTTTIGDWSFIGTIVFGGSTTTKAFGEFHIRDGGTYVDVTDYGEGTTSIVSGATFDVKLKSAHGSDTFTKEACTWEYLP